MSPSAKNVTELPTVTKDAPTEPGQWYIRSDMAEWFATWRSFRRNRTLHSWVQEQFSDLELAELATSNLTESVHRPFSFEQDYTDEQWRSRDRTITEMSERLFKKYGDDILRVLVRPFFRANDPDYDLAIGPGEHTFLVLNWIECFSHLPMATEVCDRRSLIEFLVRNALSLTAREILDGKDGTWGPVPAVRLYRSGPVKL